MSDYALSTNLYSFAQAQLGFFGWPINTGEAEMIKKLQPGDVIIPKFAQSPIWGGDEGGPEWQQKYCESIGANYEDVRSKYEEVIAGGQGAVPFLLRITEQRGDDDRPPGAPWACVG